MNKIIINDEEFVIGKDDEVVVKDNLLKFLCRDTDSVKQLEALCRGKEEFDVKLTEEEGELFEVTNGVSPDGVETTISSDRGIRSILTVEGELSWF